MNISNLLFIIIEILLKLTEHKVNKHTITYKTFNFIYSVILIFSPLKSTSSPATSFFPRIVQT